MYSIDEGTDGADVRKISGQFTGDHAFNVCTDFSGFTSTSGSQIIDTSNLLMVRYALSWMKNVLLLWQIWHIWYSGYICSSKFGPRDPNFYFRQLFYIPCIYLVCNHRLEKYLGDRTHHPILISFSIWKESTWSQMGQSRGWLAKRNSMTPPLAILVFSLLVLTLIPGITCIAQEAICRILWHITGMKSYWLRTLFDFDQAHSAVSCNS